MRLGIFAKTFARPTLPETLAAVAGRHLDCVQFNLASVGLETVPAAIPDGLAATIGRQFAASGIAMSALSGTFNLIDPDRSKRARLLQNLAVLAKACPAMETQLITLCTGTRDPADMWKAHPDNRSREAWQDLVESLHAALELTAGSGVLLGIEPEPANVVTSAEDAARLLEELDSPRLKIVFDGVNLMHAHPPHETGPVLRRALQLLAPHVVIAHAKDLEGVGAGKPPGLDYPVYLQLLAEFGFTGPLILHGMTEAQVDAALAFVRKTLDGISSLKSAGP
jgi:sugar phosphate isomerase/epimerase